MNAHTLPSPLPRRSTRGRWLAAAAMAIVAAASAQDLTPKAGPQEGSVLITGATVHPVSGPAIEDGVVYFAGGKLFHVSTRADWDRFAASARFKAPPTQIDATGKHVWPGLICPSTQLGLSEIQAVAATRDITEIGGVTPEVRACIAVNPDSTLIPVTRSNGVLLAGVFPGGGGVIPGRASVVRLDGWTVPEMTVLDSAGLALRWPSTRTITAWWMDTSEDDQRRDNSRAMEQVGRVFDEARAYADARRGDPNQPVDLRWEAMAELWGDATTNSQVERSGRDHATEVGGSRSLSKPVFVTANDVDQINGAVAFCAARGVRCVIVGGRDAAMCAALLKQHGVPVIVQGTLAMPRRADAPYDDAYTLPARLHAAGIRFTIANGDDTAHERNLPYSAAMAVAHGLPHDEGVKALTLSAAEILGVADRYGSLETGKSATLIVTTGDVLEVTTRVQRAFIDGREIDLSNKQTRLEDKYRERYRQTGDVTK